MRKQFLNLNDLSRDKLENIFDISLELKQNSKTGDQLKNKYLGTFGDFGTYSFFYSHQITSGEGGMIVCNNDKDYEILFALSL